MTGNHYYRPMTVAPGMAAALGMVFCAALVAQTQPVQSYALNNYKRVLEGQWEGMRYASDGKVYFGSSTQSAHDGASFFKYDPVTKQVTLLAYDLTTICHEDPQTNPQGKLHSDIVEANGWLYMSTHFGSALLSSYNTWSGSHVIGYELATGNFRDYGVILANYDSYSAIGVDPVRSYLYVFVTGDSPGQVSYLFRIDAVTGQKTNLGQVGGTFYSSLYMFVDRRGDVWFSVTYENGDLYQVHGDTGQMTVYHNALPPFYLWNTEQVDPNPSNQANRWIFWMQPIDGDRAIFTEGINGGMLYLFDSSKPIGSGLEFQNIKHIGYTYLGMAAGNNRVFYYQRANRGFGHQGDEDPAGIRDFHLLSVSLNPADNYAITDHGLIMDQSGRLVWRVPSMATDGQGSVFMTGDWWTIPGDLGTLEWFYNGGNETYVQLDRGEFFAVANVTLPQQPAAVSVTLNVPSVTITPPQTAQFIATVTGAADTSVTWTLSAPVGTVTGGLYTPPATVTAAQSVTVIATSNADSSKFATATINLLPNAPPPPQSGFTPIRVRAGGGAYTDPLGQVWAADTGYSGGNAFSTGASIANTNTPELYQGERWSLTPFQYQFAVPSGTYHVNLKFSENYANGPGQRVFNVLINGQQVLNNFDIFAAAGGSFRAVDQGFDTVASGLATIQLVPVTGAAKIDAFEILQQSGGGPVVSIVLNQQNVTLTPPQTAQFVATVTGATDTSVNWSLSAPIGTITDGLYTPPATITAAESVTVIATSNADTSKSATATVNLVPNGPPPPQPGFTPIRVRAGGGAYTDPLGQVWAADTGYSGGNAFSTGASIANTNTPELYQGERWSLTPFQYQFAVPSGTYHVNLKFSENYANGPGQRVFNVLINGQQVLTNFDIFAVAGGSFQALDQGFDTVASGLVTIQLVPVIGAAKIDAFEIF